MSAAAAPAPAEPFPWDAALHAGLGRLRLSPRDFWRMTPRELAAALLPPQDRRGFDRAGLAALMAAFPDDDGGGA